MQAILSLTYFLYLYLNSLIFLVNIQYVSHIPGGFCLFLQENPYENREYKRLYSITYQSLWVCSFHHLQIRIILQEHVQCLAVPCRTVAWVIAVVKENLLASLNVPDSLSAGYQVMARMFEEPLCTIVDKAVVDLMSQGSAVVGQVNQIPWKVNPLPPLLISVGKYLIARGLPVLRLTMLTG